MKNTPAATLKVFLDTSVLLSGLNSPTGASAAILALFKLSKIKIIISKEVIEEAYQVIHQKFPRLNLSLLNLLANKPHIIRALSQDEISKARRLIPTEDSPIFAGAIKSRAKIFVTLDKEFYVRAAKTRLISVMTPGEFMEMYRKNYLKLSVE